MSVLTLSNPRQRKFVLISLTVLVLVLTTAFVYRMFFAPPINSVREHDDMRVGSSDVIQLEIENATGEQNIARSVMDYLRRRRFDVVSITNHSDIIEHSVVIDRVGDTLSAQKVAYALGKDVMLIRSEIDSSRYLQSTVIIGRDYKTLKPFH